MKISLDHKDFVVPGMNFKIALLFLSFFLIGFDVFGQKVLTKQNLKDACDGLNNGSIELIVTNSGGPITVFVLGPVNRTYTPNDGDVILVDNLPASAPADYLVIVQDGVFPQLVDNFIIDNITPNLTASVDSQSDNTDCGSPNGSITLAVGGGTGVYSYSWTGPAGPYPDAPSLINVEGGTYNVEVFDAGTNCSRVLGPIILTDPILDGSLTVTAVTTPICAGGSSSIDVDLSEVGVSYQLRNDAGDVNIGAPVVGTGGTINLPTGVLTTTTTFNVLATFGVCDPVELTTLATVDVDPIPDVNLGVSAATDPICEGSSTTIDVALSEVGVSYQLRNDAGDVPIGAPVVGTGGTINLSTGVLTATTVFNVLATNGVCPSLELTTLVTVNVDANPDPSLVVTPAADPICEGGSTTVDVALSEAGMSYQLRNDAGNVNIGTPVVGTGGMINLPTGILTATTTFNVLVTNGVCPPVELATLITVNVDAAPDVTLGVMAAADPICEGSLTTIDVTLSESGYSYQLRNDVGDVNVGPPIIGTGGTISLPTGILTTTTTFNVLVTNGTCSIELTTLATVNVDAAPDLSLGVSAAASPICEGSATTIDVALSEAGYSYQLRNDAGNINIGAPVVGTGGTISLSTNSLSSTTTFNVLVTNGTCTAELTSLATVNVDAFPDVSLTVTPASDPICETSSTTIDVALSEAGYSYQLRNDAGDVDIGVPVVGTGGTISLPTGVLTVTTTFNILVVNGTCSAELTSLATVNVDAIPDASLGVSAAADPICEGSSTTIDVALSESGYSYQLRNDAGDIPVGAPVLGTGGTINLPTGVLTTTTTFNVLVTNGVCSPVELTALATVNVNTNPDVTLVVSAASDPICEGSSTTIDVALSEVGVNYQLRNDAGDVNIGSPVAGTGGTINLPTGVFTTTTTFNVLASDGICSPLELTTTATVNVDPLPDVSLGVSAATSPICEGSSTTIGVSLSEVGMSYQLRNDAGDVNIGAPVIGTGATINLPTGALTATTTFNVEVTNGVCVPVELSTLVTVNVDAAPDVSLAVTAAVDPICEGGSTTIDVDLSETGYSYQLRNDAGDINIGTPVIGTGGTINLATGALTTTTTFNVLVTNGSCSFELTTLATVNVDAAPDLSLAVNAGADPICEGSATTIDVDLSETGYSYQLRDDAGDVNIGAPVIGTGGTISLPTGVLTATTTFNVLVTNGTCSLELTNLATVNVDAFPDVSLVVSSAADPICEGNSTTIDVDLSETGYSYQLRNDAGDIPIGTPVVGTGATINLPTDILLTTTTFNVLVTNGICSVELMTLVTVNVDAAPDLSLNVNVAADPICEGSATTIDVDLSEAGYSYQLRDDAGDVNVGTPVLGTGGTINLPTGVLTTTTTFNVEVTNGTCTAELLTLATVTINTLSTDPTAASVDTPTYCDDAAPTDITLSYTGGSLGTGATAEWYDDAAFTSNVGAGQNLTITAPTVTTTYYVRFEGTCNITADQNVTVTVDNASIAPTGASADITAYCDDAVPANITLSYTGGSLGTNATAEWYDDAAFASNIGTGQDLVITAPSLSTTYFVRFEGDCNFTAGQSILIDVVSAPDPTISGNQSVCANTTETYTAAAGADSYVWTITGGDGVIASGQGTASITIDWGVSGGNLALDVTGSAPTNCSANDNFDVGVFTSIPDLPTQSINECQNSAIPTLVATPIPSAVIEWYDGPSATGTLLHTGDTFTPSAADLDMTTPGTTVFTYLQTIGCLTSNDATYTVNVEAQPNAGDNGATNSCLIDPPFDLFLHLGGSPDTGGTWTDDDGSGALSGSVFAPGVAGQGVFNFTYTVDGTGACTGQDSSAVVTVTVVTTSTAPVPDQPSYVGCTYDTAPTMTTPGNSIRWYDDAALTNLVATGNTYTPKGIVNGVGDIDTTAVGTTTFYVTQDDGCGEGPAATVDVILEGGSADIGEITNSYPEQDIGAIEVINIQSDYPPYEIRLEDLAGNVIYDWEQVEEDRLGDYSYLFTLLAAGDYLVWIMDDNGCMFPVEATIGLETDVFIPNVFTPNGDGYNEYFKVLNVSGPIQLTISNRWGVRVYQSDDYQNDWDASGLAEGVYYYHIKMSGTEYQGNVEVWRHSGPAGN